MLAASEGTGQKRVTLLRRIGENECVVCIDDGKVFLLKTGLNIEENIYPTQRKATGFLIEGVSLIGMVKDQTMFLNFTSKLENLYLRSSGAFDHAKLMTFVQSNQA